MSCTCTRRSFATVLEGLDFAHTDECLTGLDEESILAELDRALVEYNHLT